MKLYLNQQVICVNDRFTGICWNPVKRGAIYTIDGFYSCPCGSQQITLAEYDVHTNMGCRCHRTHERRQSYYKWRFVPLDQLEQYLEFPVQAKEPERVFAGQTRYSH